MKIATFYPTTGAAWSVAYGVPRTLARMGHDVLDSDQRQPTFEELKTVDAILVAGPEYVHAKLYAQYPDWDSLKVPRIGWLHETVEREDYATNHIAVDGKLPVFLLKNLTPHLFTMAHHDQKYGMPFVQCGVDLEKFQDLSRERTTEVLFTGSLYGKRREFLDRYPHVSHRLTYKMVPTVDDYVDELNRAKVVLNLPSMSAMSTARVFESMACGAALVTPMLDGPGNFNMFQHGQHLLYYTGDPTEILDILEYRVEEKRINRPLSGSLRERVALAGQTEVRAHHSLENRLKSLLEAA